jgi:hypothetical protein
MKIGSILDLSFSPFFRFEYGLFVKSLRENSLVLTMEGGGGGALVCNKKVNMTRMTRVTMKE